jgi:hypothetical protein
MTFRRGRVRRPDDWPSSHARARAALSERLDANLDPTEAAWLEAHLASCADCRAAADAYAAQRLELQSLRDRMPPPPRDLWARTAAAIETESRFRDGRARSSGLTNPRRVVPSVLLAMALVVAVGVGVLTSSQHPGAVGTAGPSTQVAAGSEANGSAAPAATPLRVAQKIEYLTRGADGSYTLQTKTFDRLCPATSSGPCETDAPAVKSPVLLGEVATSAFGSRDNRRLIVVNDASTMSDSGTVSVVVLPSPDVEASAAPSAVPASASVAPTSPATVATATPTVRASASPRSLPPTVPPTATAPIPPSGSPPPSIAVTPSPSGGPIEIAHDVALVGQSAAYSLSGDWFAFTARPIDGSAGPDIYLWQVGDQVANRVTSDHRSVFGSWVGDVVVGSTVTERTTGKGASAVIDLEPSSFLLDPATSTTTALPQTGQAWRPAVDPTGRKAVYWTGTLRPTADPGYAPKAGRLVLGDWTAAGPTASAEAQPTALVGDQSAARHETTIAAGQMEDWDARWDGSGTHLAVWIADPQNSDFGRLSLYAVDSFDGHIDLKTPLLDAAPAAAGYAISDGKLVWGEPSTTDPATSRTIQLLAWTDTGVGTVETVTGPAIVIR